ncbi:MAG: hypothetical protein UIC63_08915, partial [Bacteroidaceae bacterium]|nr:hypothetical protein [Bacteroidaceae bacterium]
LHPCMMVLYAVMCFVLSFSAFNHITYLAEELLQEMAIFFRGFRFFGFLNEAEGLYNKTRQPKADSHAELVSASHSEPLTDFFERLD